MKKHDKAGKHPFTVSIRGQLMLFIGGITLFTLLLVWSIITFALEPQYNRNIRAKLDSKAAAITALIDQSDAEISSRTYQGLYLNDEFWSGVSQTFRDKKINVDGNCVDFSDSTLRCLKAYESMYPCLLHESTGAFGGDFGYNVDTRVAIQLRQKLFEEGSLYQIIRIGSSMQMCVGRLSADGQYGVIVSTSLAQITTAAEVLRTILGPVALVLLVLDLLLAVLFSRWFTSPIRKLSNGAQEIAAGNYDVAIRVEHAEPAVDMPLTALRLQRLVRGACCAAARPADCQLHRQHRQPHKHQKKQVEQHKDTAAALARNGGKPPDIADTDRAAGADKDEAKARAEALSLFLGFHTIPLFSQSSIIIAYHGEACKR